MMILHAVAAAALSCAPPVADREPVEPPSAPKALLAKAAQDDDKAKPKKKARPRDVDRIDDFIRHARVGSAMMRPQAAARLVRVGAPAAKRLLEVSGETTDDLALLGTSLIEILGEFDSPKLRAKLWPAMEDSEFPWRPATARSLAFAPEESEWSRFEGYLDDPIAPVRLGVLDALFRISQVEGETPAAKAVQATRKRAFLAHARAALVDESDIVRRRAAVLLDARGHGRALFWLLEDLKRNDMFFDRPTGLAARYDAMNQLMDRGIDVGSYIPELPAAPDPKGKVKDSNKASLKAIQEALEERAGLMEAKLPEDLRGLVPREIPPVARAGAVIQGAVLGLELKSCRRGDFSLRWTEDDKLIVGYGNAAQIPLPKGTTAKLVELSKKTQAAVGDQVFWGRPGCDAEAYRMPRINGPSDFPQHLIVSKNEQAAEDLRPGALTELGAALAGSIPSDKKLLAADSRTRELASRVRGAFASIGGPVD